jgi:hypothetical protein
MACTASGLACHFHFNLQEEKFMALADLWDNLKQPYFIPSAINDMKDLARELKDIIVDFVEEADELFTVGFREMVIKKNNSYQTSSEMRQVGRQTIRSLKTICLDTRGIDSASREVMRVLDLDFEMIVDSLTEFGADQIDTAVNDLQGKFKQLEFLAPHDLKRFRSRAVQILAVPEPPTYKAPPSDEQGPIGLFTSNKHKRISAAQEYLAMVNDYKILIEGEMAKQKVTGPIFDSSMLNSGVGDLILRLGSRYWSACSLDDRKRLHCFLLLANGICNPLSFATKLADERRRPDFAEMLTELERVDTLTATILTEHDSQPEDKMQPIIKTVGLPLPI